VTITIQQTGEQIVFDAVLREVHGGGATAPKHVVERGDGIRYELTDDALVGPRKLSLVGSVSNDPIEVPSTQMGGITGEVGEMQISVTGPQRLVRGANAATGRGAEYEQADFEVARPRVLQFSADFDRVTAVLSALEQIRTGALLVTVETTRGQYTDCLLLSYTAPIERGVRGADIALEFEEQRFAETQRVQVPDPVEPRGRAPRDVGTQPVQPVPAGSKGESRASALYEARRLGL
jgi:hypothetical protein